MIEVNHNRTAALLTFVGRGVNGLKRTIMLLLEGISYELTDSSKKQMFVLFQSSMGINNELFIIKQYNQILSALFI